MSDDTACPSDRLTGSGIGSTIVAMRPPSPSRERWIADQRGEGRAVRVSAHAEGGFLVLSTWKEDTCVSTVRLLPDEAALLVAGLADGLSRLSDRPSDDIASRLATVEATLASMDSRAQRPTSQRG